MEVLKIYFFSPPGPLPTPLTDLSLLVFTSCFWLLIFHQMWQLILNLNFRPLTYLLECNDLLRTGPDRMQAGATNLGQMVMIIQQKKTHTQ